ncbi:MAG: cyclic nucleotide-binding domain-containing protein [Methyloligellaceae bacterium]
MVRGILSLPVFDDIDPNEFPDDLALTDIIANDARMVQYARGDVVFRQGDYGHSVFVVLRGSVKGLATERGGQFILGFTEIFGVSATLARGPRTHTVISDDDATVLLELSWPGLRDIRQWSDAFRAHIDELYRTRSLQAGLRNSALFDHVDDATLNAIAQHCQFETHGKFEWAHPYQREIAGERGHERIIEHEPIILEQGHYLDDLLLVHAGFARVSEKLDRGEKTVGHLTKGDVFGLAEIIESQQGGGRMLRQSLRAIGYADIIRVPTPVVEHYVLPALPKQSKAGRSLPFGNKAKAARSGLDGSHLQQSMLDFSVDNRFINGTKAMAINTDRCVNCDECVRACAATHDNIPRFVRRGKSHQNLMIANACMHCVDPVCLIDCPTGAIRRDVETGSVVIDDATCIGCATCASACPYDNIRMEEVRDSSGAFLVDEDGVQVLRATKCDLCAGQRGGPACQRACPHDALVRIDIQNAHTLSDWLELSQ